MVKAGEKYKHFKGGEYEILEVAHNCDNPEQKIVVYRALYGEGKVWVRLFEEFVGFKEVDGKKIRRFVLVSNNMVNVKVKKLKENAVVPSYAHPGDAAMDLYSAEDCVILSGKRQLVSTGIAMELPEGYWANIREKGGLASKRGISLLGGVIEYTYRGEYKIVVLNTGDEDFVIKTGDKIAQVVIGPVSMAEVEVVENLSESVRGDGAWGSTGGSNV